MASEDAEAKKFWKTVLEVFDPRKTRYGWKLLATAIFTIAGAFPVAYSGAQFGFMDFNRRMTSQEFNSTLFRQRQEATNGDVREVKQEVAIVKVRQADQTKMLDEMRADIKLLLMRERK